MFAKVFDSEKRELAIKKAHSDSYQSIEKFHNEVELLSRIRHRNLVEKRQRPTWKQRANIAIRSAKGIAHLHEVQPSIIHREPSNILVDEGFEPKVSDFGLVKMVPDCDASHVSTDVKGTPGYMDPAYCSSLHLTPSSDVYSFGVILLQLFSSFPDEPAINARQMEHMLAIWQSPYSFPNLNVLQANRAADPFL